MRSAELKTQEYMYLTFILRSEVELFYSRGSISDAISSLNAKHEEEAQRKKGTSVEDICDLTPSRATTSCVVAQV